MVPVRAGWLEAGLGRPHLWGKQKPLSAMYTDFLTALQAGLPHAPAIISRNEQGWFLYNPTQPPGEQDEPHVLLGENGVLMALNRGGTELLCTLAFTGGHA